MWKYPWTCEGSLSTTHSQQSHSVLLSTNAEYEVYTTLYVQFLGGSGFCKHTAQLELSACNVITVLLEAARTIAKNLMCLSIFVYAVFYPLTSVFWPSSDQFASSSAVFALSASCVDARKPSKAAIQQQFLRRSPSSFHRLWAWVTLHVSAWQVTRCRKD